MSSTCQALCLKHKTDALQLVKHLHWNAGKHEMWKDDIRILPEELWDGRAEIGEESICRGGLKSVNC